MCESALIVQQPPHTHSHNHKTQPTKFLRSLFRYWERQLGFKTHTVLSDKYLNANSGGTGDPVRGTKAYVEWRYSPIQSQHPHYMVVCLRFHDPANLPPGKTTTGIRWKLRTPPSRYGHLRRTEKCIVPAKIESFAGPGGLVTTPTELTPPQSKLNVIVYVI